MIVEKDYVFTCTNIIDFNLFWKNIVFICTKIIAIKVVSFRKMNI